jgi:DNA repair protein RadA/Sms
MKSPLIRATVVCGEVGLAGEIRAVGQMEMRLREAGRLGFKTFLMPESSARQLQGTLKKGMRILPVRTVAELAESLFRT